MLLAGLVSQKKERAVVGDPGTKLQHNSTYAGVAKIFSVHDLPAFGFAAAASSRHFRLNFAAKISSRQFYSSPKSKISSRQYYSTRGSLIITRGR